MATHQSYEQKSAPPCSKNAPISKHFTLLRAILLLLIVSNRASAVTDDIHDFSEALSLVQSSKSNHSPCMEKAIES